MFKYLNLLRKLGQQKSKTKAAAFVARQGASLLVKLLVFKTIALILAAIIPLLIIIALTTILFLVYTQILISEVDNTQNVQETILNSRSSSFFRWFFTGGSAGNFNPTSPIPHWIPADGRLSQTHCSNFYSILWGLTYTPTRRQLNFETECQLRMSQDPRFRDFAQKYGGGRWENIWAHWGIDIANRIGTSVYSMNRGEVIRVGSDAIWGNFVDVYSDTGQGSYVVRYAHLSQVLIKEGQVYGWELLARMWNTWKSTAPHLHLGICKDGNAFNDCYTGAGEMVDALPYMFNYIINWQNISFIENEREYVWQQVYAGTGKPGLELSNTSSSFNFWNVNVDQTLTAEIRDFIYIKIWNEYDIAPIVIKAIHFKEGWLRTTNPQPRNDPGWSGQNEGVYGIYSDFRNLTPYCIRSQENFGGFGRELTVREFENQTRCAAEVLIHKFGSRKNLLTQSTFSIESLGEKQEFCQAIRWYNAGPFYCWNNLYPTYSSDSSLTNMPVRAGGRIIGTHRMDGILKYILDNKSSFQQAYQYYTLR